MKNKVGRPAKDGIKMGFLIEKNLANEFNEFCDKSARNKTKTVEQALREYMDKYRVQF